MICTVNFLAISVMAFRGKFTTINVNIISAYGMVLSSAIYVHFGVYYFVYIKSIY